MSRQYYSDTLFIIFLTSLFLYYYISKCHYKRNPADYIGLKFNREQESQLGILTGRSDPPHP